jgi:DNA-binding MarR family transcriptional regulator
MLLLIGDLRPQRSKPAVGPRKTLQPPTKCLVRLAACTLQIQSLEEYAVPKTTTQAKAVTERERPAKKTTLTVSRPELLVDGSDGQFRKLVHDMFAFFSRHQAIREGHAAQIGLAGIEYTILISIRQLSYEGDVHVARVAEHLHLSGAFITTIIHRLTGKGLVEKTPQPDDRRRVRLTVTKTGMELLERLAPRQRKVNDVQFECLDAREFLQLSKMMERLVDSADKALSLQRYLRENNME